MLTDRQEKYVQNLLKGMSQRQAYRDAYPKNRGSDETIDSRASTLLKTDKVFKRYNELREKAEDEARENFGKDNEREAYLSDKMKAMDILNKMSGEYVTKIEGDIGITTIEVELND